jgi:hypothetical protein
VAEKSLGHILGLVVVRAVPPDKGIDGIPAAAANLLQDGGGSGQAAARCCDDAPMCRTEVPGAGASHFGHVQNTTHNPNVLIAARDQDRATPSFRRPASERVSGQNAEVGILVLIGAFPYVLAHKNDCILA